MAYDEETKEIEGLEISISPLPFMRALKLKRKLIAMFGENIKPVFGIIPKDVKGVESILKSDIDFEKVGGMISQVITYFDDDKLEVAPQKPDQLGDLLALDLVGLLDKVALRQEINPGAVPGQRAEQELAI